MPYVSTGEAARILVVSASTVLNMLERGDLLGRRGNQPRRPRWQVQTDLDGVPLGPNGPVQASAADVPAETRDRETAGSSAPPSDQSRYREAALLLVETLERQRRAIELQAEANRELNAALSEQSRILTTLLVPDIAELKSD